MEGRKRRKSGTTPYLHIKKAIRRTRLCKRRGRLRVPTGDEKNCEIRALINLLSGTADRRRRSGGGGGGGSSDEIFVGLSSLSRGLSEAAREFKVLRRAVDERAPSNENARDSSSSSSPSTSASKRDENKKLKVY